MENAPVVPSRMGPVASLNERSVVNDNAYLDSVDSALCALTDFQHDDPITVEADCCIEDALADMNRMGVHAFLVTQQELGGVDQQVIGLITHYDIQCRHRRPETHSSIIRVGEVMTAWDQLALVKYESLRILTAYNLNQMFQGTGLTHLLVVEFHAHDSVVARGLLSRATLAKRLHRSRTASSR
jgi:signal-transduction protein with cAMP-binding, CBS, and nucleotidyltransferase domain